MKLSFRILISIIFLFLTTSLFAQNFDKNMKADDLTDEQVAKIKTRITAEGITIEEFESRAIASGAPAAEVAKIKERILLIPDVTIEPAEEKDETKPKTTDKYTTEKKAIKKPEKKSNIFGAELFNNPSISFEPNQNMPTPKNYILSTGDQVTVDIYGYSEGTYKLKVTPDGNIRIPNVGPISVSGLTIEQAKSRISDYLANHGFSNIKSGNTSINITLGNIRSIKVMVIGEVQAPGTYTISSLSTVYTALYSSGGPGKNGSYRDIQLIRDNKVISTIDVYDFLMKGDRSGDLNLKDQDVIKVNPYKSRVWLAGEVKRPLIFEAIESDNLQNMIGYAGGFTSEAYKMTINVIRNTEREKQIIDINQADYANFKPGNGDSCTIGKILARYTNRISITGSVFRPGAYSMTEGMTVADLVNKADGLTEDAYLQKSTLFRKGKDLTPGIQSVNLQKVLDGTENITLQKEDSLVVFSKHLIREPYTIIIRGEVLKPGTFNYSENMHVSDIIYMAGGLKENASNELEISRRIKDANVFDKNSFTAQVFSYTIMPVKDTLVLQPYDEVFVKPLPGYKFQVHVTIQGEVAFPGDYTLENSNERISTLVKRAGGLTGAAFQPGATLDRKGKPSTEVTYKEQLAISTLSKVSKDTLSSTQKKDLITEKSNLVGIQLDLALSNPNSEWDLILEEGDVLTIPKELQTVSINGQVLFPSRIPFKKGKSFKDYVYSAGGFSENANRSRAYVIYPNNNIKSTKSFLGFKSYPDIVAGSDIYIPENAKKKTQLSSSERTAILISAFSSVATIAILLYSVMK